MGPARGWWVIVVVLLPILLALPVGALDVNVSWSLAQPPSVDTGTAADVTSGEATLRGTLIDLGGASAVGVSFEWGLSPALGEETTAQLMVSPGSFEARLSELEADQSYYYRAKATGNGTALGSTVTFQTVPIVAAGEILPFWVYLAIIAAAVVVALFIFRERIPALLGPLYREKEREDDEKVQAVDVTLARIKLLQAEGTTPEREEELTNALLENVASVQEEAPVELEGPRYVDPAEVKRRQAIFQNRINSADRRLKRDPKDTDALFAKATYLAMREEYDEALRYLDDLTRADPGYPGAWYLKAKIFQLMGNLKMAELCLMSASKLA